MVRVEKITKQVNKLLSINNVLQPPVPIFNIAEKCGITISFEPYVDGVKTLSSMYYNSKNIIGINSALSNEDQRFCCAHQIGHKYLHTKELYVDKIIKTNLKEGVMVINFKDVEANRFAIDLLIPPIFLEIKLQKIKCTTKQELIATCARVFKVSCDLMSCQLYNLGVIVG